MPFKVAVAACGLSATRLMVFWTPLVPVRLKVPAPLMVLTTGNPVNVTGCSGVAPDEPAVNLLPVKATGKPPASTVSVSALAAATTDSAVFVEGVTVSDPKALIVTAPVELIGCDGDAKTTPTIAVPSL